VIGSGYQQHLFASTRAPDGGLQAKGNLPRRKNRAPRTRVLAAVPSNLYATYLFTRKVAYDELKFGRHKHREESAMPQVGSHVHLKKTPESVPVKTHNQWHRELSLVLPLNNRIAHDGDERSAHEPKVMRREDVPRDHRHQGPQHGVSPLIKQQFGDVPRNPPDRPWTVGR
jgi:hypothetical protein